MSGARYHDWTHVRVVGDRDAASRHLPDARKLLGFVSQEAARNNLGTASLNRRLDDGTLIVAELHGTIPRITIVTPEATTGRQERSGGDFVVWARDDSLPAGIDDEHPQQILRPTEDGWMAYVFDQTLASYGDGTYGGRLPQGLRHAGNIDWAGPAGVRLSWYGPSTRYWIDPFVQPQQQYGRQVFLLGQVLLDTDAYIADSAPEPAFNERYVMGAALRGPWLYVVHAQLPLFTTPLDPLPADTITTSAFYPTTDLPHVLCRYGVAADEAGDLHVLPGSREVMWSGDLRTGGMPWFFDPAVERAHCFGVAPGVFGGIDFVRYAPATGSLAPSETSPIFRLLISDDTATLAPSSSVSVQPEGAATLAGDYTLDGDLVEITVRREAHPLGMAVGDNWTRDHWLVEAAGASALLFQMTRGAGGADNFTWRYLMHADARVGLLVLAREEMTFLLDEVSRQVWLEVYRGGDLVYEALIVEHSGTDQITGLARDFNGSDDVQSPWRELPVSPMYALYNFLFYSVGVTSGASYRGSHAGYLVLPYQAGAYFGARKIGGPAGPPSLIAEWCSVPPERERLDADGKDWVLGVASSAGETILSGYTFVPDQLDSVSHISRSTLSAVTWVDGANSRYHPIWRLGEPPALQ